MMLSDLISAPFQTVPNIKFAFLTVTGHSDTLNYVSVKARQYSFSSVAIYSKALLNNF